MRRIGLVVGLTLSLLAPLAVDAQQAGKIPRVGMIVPGSASSFASRIAAFRQGLRELGDVEGRNILVEYRFADGRPERFPALADELVRLDVRVIVTMGTPATLAAKEASKTVPIVMANVGEAVDLGIVASLAHPGGNVTGSSYLMLDLITKRLELLKEMLPNVTDAAVLSDPTNPIHDRALHGLETAARSLGLTLHFTAARDFPEIKAAISTMTEKRIRAVIVLEDGVFFHLRDRIATQAIRSRLATINGLPEEVEAGGLIAYGPSLTDLAHRAATFVDKILKGAKPADLPVEQPTRFELVINLRTAKALALIIPQSVLMRADEIIQ